MFEEKEKKLVKKRKICEKQGSMEDRISNLVKKRKFIENEGSMEDWIRELPEELIFCNILSRLSTIDALKTSILSTNWRHLWKSVPVLALHSRKFSTGNDMVNFINKFLFLHKDSLIRKFQLRIFEPDDNEEWLAALYTDYNATQWIDVLTTRHKIQHLDFSFGNSGYRCIDIPLSMYTSETLVSLRLVEFGMVDSKFVSLPCLKSIYLRSVHWPNVTILEKFISNSRVLEDLTILEILLDDNVDIKPLPLRLQSHTLERICIDDLSNNILKVVIDAPLLKCLTIKLDLYYLSRSIYSGLSPKVQVHVKLKCNELYGIPNDLSVILFNLTNISIIIKDLVISRNAWKIICRHLNVDSFPQFGYMSCLNVNLSVSKLKWFPKFLESCPNLKSLSMEWRPSSKKKKYIRFKSVPECLLSSLECVDIKAMVSEDAIEVKVAKYFLDNALILKKLTLRLNSHPKKNDIFKKILKFPKRSIASQLMLL